MWANTRIIHYFNSCSFFFFFISTLTHVQVHFRNQFHIHYSMVLSKWSHVVILLTKENTCQPGPTTKDMWVSLLFWLKVIHLHLLQDYFSNNHPNKWKCKHTYSRVKSCIGRGSFWFWTFLCERLSDIFGLPMNMMFWTV